MAVKGLDFLIKVNTTGSTFVTLGGLTANSMSMNKEQIDITNKDSDQWRRLLAAGVRSMSMSGSGIFTNGAAYAKLRTAFLANQHVNLELFDGIGNKYAAAFEIASIEESGDHNGAHQFSVSFESAGAVSFTPAA